MVLLAHGCSKSEPPRSAPAAMSAAAEGAASAPAKGQPSPRASAPPLVSAEAAVEAGSAPPAPNAGASAAPAGPCPADARRDDAAGFCIVFGAKPLAVSYEGDSPDDGITEQLEVEGIDVLLRQVPARGKTVGSLRAGVRAGAPNLVAHGELPEGAFAHYYSEKDGLYTVTAQIIAKKYVITCTANTREQSKLERALSLCKSLRAL